jgi:hypothetical protein
VKRPAAWSPTTPKTPAKWAGVVKTAAAWAGSSIIKTKAPAQAWTGTPKTADAWGGGDWPYNTYLPYNTSVTYNGTPKPVNAKIPAAWSTT